MGHTETCHRLPFWLESHIRCPQTRHTLRQGEHSGAFVPSRCRLGPVTYDAGVGPGAAAARAALCALLGEITGTPHTHLCSAPHHPTSTASCRVPSARRGCRPDATCLGGAIEAGGSRPLSHFVIMCGRRVDDAKPLDLVSACEGPRTEGPGPGVPPSPRPQSLRPEAAAGAFASLKSLDPPFLRTLSLTSIARQLYRRSFTPSTTFV